MSSGSEERVQALIGWRGIELHAPTSLRLTAERVGPQSSYSIFTDQGYPRLELIVDRSRSYGFPDLGGWVDRLVKSREKDKWEILGRGEAVVGGHQGLRIVGSVGGAKFVAFTWPCRGRLNFLKINLMGGEDEEDASSLVKSVRCHRPDAFSVIALYEFQIRVPATLWTTSLIATAGDLCLYMEDQHVVAVIERGGPVEVLDLTLEQWLREYHQKKLERYKVFIGKQSRVLRDQPHDTWAFHVHPKGLMVRRKVVGVTRAWRCDLNSRYWACTVMSLERRFRIDSLPNLEIDCHARKV